MPANAARTARPTGLIGLSSRVTRTTVALVALCLIVVAFGVGEGHGRRTTVLTGVAYTGLNEATVTVAGWSYGISGTGITWYDSQGTLHDNGWPSCLRGIGRRVPITFGAVPVTGPGGDSWRQVVWVDCRR
jgi:hypothetical protein